MKISLLVLFLLWILPLTAAVVPRPTYISLTQLPNDACTEDDVASFLVDEMPGEKIRLCRALIYLIEDYAPYRNLEPTASICLSHSANSLQNSLSTVGKESQQFEQRSTSTSFIQK